MVSVLATEPSFAGLNAAEAMDFKGDKNSAACLLSEGK
jgi:hypothetical protein